VEHNIETYRAQNVIYLASNNNLDFLERTTDPRESNVALQIICMIQLLIPKLVPKACLLWIVSPGLIDEWDNVIRKRFGISKSFNVTILRLTCPRRLSWWSGWENPLFLFPLTISSTKTPKLKTSDFVE
jgi:hypothetical protein